MIVTTMWRHMADQKKEERRGSESAEPLLDVTEPRAVDVTNGRLTE
jgi:hypothetical protein